jgi:predicted metallo-beta-lactamase superfamily hydrolase
MRIKILLLAFDSLGTRSMATYVEAGDAKILIDSGIAREPILNISLKNQIPFSLFPCP